jgi:hypothetical protein
LLFHSCFSGSKPLTPVVLAVSYPAPLDHRIRVRLGHTVDTCP